VKYNFDEIIDRTITNDIKWKINEEVASGEVVPMWVADMDLKVANPIVEAIENRIKTPIFGYSSLSDYHKQIVADFFNRRHNYNVLKQDVLFSTGVVYSINAILQKYTKENDKVMIMLPSYGPFVSVTKSNKRIPIYTHLKLVDGKYKIDFDEMEEVVEDCKVLILCNPHNPTGKVFTKEELIKISDFAKKHEMLIISDEIHCDFDYHNKFIPIISVNEYARENTIALTSITKTFNLAGVKVSFIFVKNEKIREELEDFINLLGISSINTFAIEILEATYTKCDDWLDECLSYLKSNIDYVMKRLEKIPEIKCIKPDSTYLMWLDMSELDITKEKLHQTIIDEAKILFTSGDSFGDKYINYERMNIACPQSQVKETMDRLEEFVKKYRK